MNNEPLQGLSAHNDVVRINPSAYCLTKNGREMLNAVEVNTLTGKDDNAPVYSLSFPLVGSKMRGVYEEHNLQDIMQFYNGMCLGAVIKSRELEVEAANVPYKASTYVCQCPKCGEGRAVLKAEDVGKKQTGTDVFIRICPHCQLKLSLVLDRDHSSIFVRFGDDKTVAGDSFVLHEKTFPVRSRDCLGYGGRPYLFAKDYVGTCCDCGKTHDFTVDVNAFTCGRYSFGCACGASATLWFNPDGTLASKWKSPDKPECPVDAALVPCMDNVVGGDGQSSPKDSMWASRRAEALRDLGYQYWKLKGEAFAHWRRELRKWEEENNPDNSN